MTEVGNVYGEALYDLAKSENLSGLILEELKVLQESFRREPDFLTLLAAPSLTKAERCQILEDSFRGKIHSYVLNFLKILTEKGYIRHFSHCCDAYRGCYNRDNGILSVTAVTAVPLSQEQNETLKKKLYQLTQKQIDLHNRIDPAVLGGVRLDYQDQRLDDTLARRMASIRELLAKTVL